MSNQILFPDEVSAFRVGSNPEVTIIARGREDGFCKIHIEASLAQIYPPIYMVVGEECPVIGNFPYSVSKTVPYATDLDYVNFQTSKGTQRVNIVDVLADTDNAPKALLDAESKAAPDNQVTGIAPNSSDINTAIANAISKLRTKFPNGINAVVTKSGFVAAGSPVGIAYFYVVMEQQSS